MNRPHKHDPPPAFQLTVNNGSGDGWYPAGAPVSIVANDIATKEFTGWTGPFEIVFADAKKPTTTLKMSIGNATVAAQYQDSQRKEQHV